MFGYFFAVFPRDFPRGSTGAQEPEKDLVARGQYVFGVAGGCACHTIPNGAPNIGGRAFPIPFGTVYSTNITPDKETGLGNWSDKEIADAMTKGIRPDGDMLVPVMPYGAYSGMARPICTRSRYGERPIA